MASSLGNKKVLVHECVLAFEPDVRPSPTLEMQNRHRKCKTDTTGKLVEIFAVRFFRAHGKGFICRAFFIQRMAKKKRAANVLFAVRYKKTKKRTTKILFPDVIKKRTVKIFFAVRFFIAHTKVFFSP